MKAKTLCICAGLAVCGTAMATPSNLNLQTKQAGNILVAKRFAKAQMINGKMTRVTEWTDLNPTSTSSRVVGKAWDTAGVQVAPPTVDGLGNVVLDLFDGCGAASLGGAGWTGTDGLPNTGDESVRVFFGSGNASRQHSHNDMTGIPAALQGAFITHFVFAYDWFVSGDGTSEPLFLGVATYETYQRVTATPPGRNCIDNNGDTLVNAADRSPPGILYDAGGAGTADDAYYGSSGLLIDGATDVSTVVIFDYGDIPSGELGGYQILVGIDVGAAGISTPADGDGGLDQVVLTSEDGGTTFLVATNAQPMLYGSRRAITEGAGANLAFYTAANHPGDTDTGSWDEGDTYAEDEFGNPLGSGWSGTGQPDFDLDSCGDNQGSNPPPASATAEWTLWSDFGICPDDLNPMAAIWADPDFVIPTDCLADCNGDTSLDAFDFNCFVDEFNNGNLALADINGDTSLDAFDFNAFVDAFNAGCTF